MAGEVRVAWQPLKEFTKEVLAQHLRNVAERFGIKLPPGL